MLRNNLIIAWRNLMRHRLHTVINLAGLSLGMAFCLLAWRFASQEWSFDRFHSKADRIYRVYVEAMGSEEGLMRIADVIDFAFAPELEALAPHVERTVRLSAGDGNERKRRVVRMTFAGSSSEEEFLAVDPAFFEVFDFPLLLGDAATALAERNSVVMSYEMAQRLFGDADPLGQNLTMRGTRSDVEDFTITGVAAPVPHASSIQFNMLLPFENTEFLFHKLPNEWDGSCNAYVLLASDADPADLAPAFVQITRDMAQRDGGEIPEDLPEDFSWFRLQPLTDLHSDTGLMNFWIGHGVVEPRDPFISYVLVSIALTVLLMGCINFVNLAIGRASLRAAEIGVRKAAGAGRGQLMRQFIGEAVVLSIVGVGAGCALAALLLPAFNATFSQELSLGLSEPSMLGALGALLLLVSLGAGWYPALVLSRLTPLNAIRRNVSITGVTRLSRVLVSVQLAISVGLITSTLVMYHQLEHLMTRHTDQERVILVDTDSIGPMNRLNSLVDAFLQHSRLASISLMDEDYEDFLEFGRFSGRFWAVTESGREASILPYEVDHNFVETLNLELIHGRDFSLDQGDKDNLVVISESAAARLGFADPIGETIDIVSVSGSERHPIGGRSGIGTGARIIGVVKDFTFESGYEDFPPGLLLLAPDYGTPDLMFVRVKPGDMQEVVQYMQETWSSIVSDEDFHFSFLQQDMEAAYRDELRWRRLITWAAVGAVFISALGAFALTALAAGRRTKEIGIRKALGASVFGLTTLMTREFACLALIGSAVAWPLSWWWMRDWLNGFAFRIDLAAWHFAAGAAIALVAVLLSSGHQAYKAAKADPVEALRYE